MKRSRVAVTVAGLACLAFAGAGCSATSDTESAESTAAPDAATIAPDNSAVSVADSTIADATIADQSATDTSVAATSAVPVAGAVPEALQFTAPAVGGGEIDVASFAGKPTVFWFWAPT